MIIKVVDANLIYCLIPFILTLIFIELFFRDRLQTRKALRLVKWIIISYTAVILLHFIIEMVCCAEQFGFWERATGPYKIAYWLMLLAAFVLPFTLLIKKLGNMPGYILFVAFFMKMGVYFERFVILTTTYHRDYAPDTDWQFPTAAILLLGLQGIGLALLSLGVLEIMASRK